MSRNVDTESYPLSLRQHNVAVRLDGHGCSVETNFANLPRAPCAFSLVGVIM